MEKDEITKLLEEKKYNVLKEKLKEINSADIPPLLEELDKESVVKLFRILPKEQAGEAFSYMEPYMKEKLIQDLTDAELKGILNELFMDDTVDLIEEMPSNVVKKILKVVNAKDRKIINELLQYPEDSAGSIMTTEFIDLKETMTVEQALQRINANKKAQLLNESKDTFNTNYLTAIKKDLTKLAFEEYDESVISMQFNDEDKLISDLDFFILIKNLSYDERITLTLYYLENLTTKQISEILKEPESTIRNRISRARIKIKNECEGGVLK